MLQTKFIGSMIWNQLGRVGEVGLSLLFTALIVRWLNVTDFSIYSTLVNLATLFSFVISLGLSDGILRYIPTAQKINPAAPFLILRRFLVLRLLVFGFFGLVIWLLKDWLADLLGQPFLKSDAGLLLLLLFTLNLVDLVTYFYNALFWAREIVLIRLIGQFLNIAMIIGWVYYSPLSLGLVILSLGLGNLFVTLACLLVLRRRGLFQPIIKREIWAKVKGIYSYSRDLWLINLVTLGLMGQIDIVILSLRANDLRAVAYYSLATILINRVYSLIVAWTGSLNSITATVLIEKGQPGIERYFSYYYRLNLLVHLTTVAGMASVAEPLSSFLFGERYREVGILVIFLTLQHGIAAVLGHTICAAFINTLGRQKVILVWRCILSILNIVLDILLVPSLGAYGVVLATLFCNVFLYIIEFILLKELFKKLQLSYTLKITIVVISGGILASLVGELQINWFTILVRGSLYLLYIICFFFLIKPIKEIDRQIITNLKPGLARFTRFFSQEEKESY